MMKYLKICLILSLWTLASCDSQDSPAVKSCKDRCESNRSLQVLQTKVAYRPIKLCQKRCGQTGGTCLDKGKKGNNHRACIYFGMNAGSMTPRRGGLLKFN